MSVDNPPAFPTSSFAPGMSMLDYFAGQVLNGMIADGLRQSLTNRSLALAAYDLAEAMLDERARRQS